jgi:UDP-N-acetylglucosamine--N-acetylmuramyl-(pentapeptide) pyrophosphoryl-undecaprenol N-acetylglucosamine transferase
VLAVVDALERRAKRQGTRLQVLYIGRHRGIERELALAAGLNYVGVAGGKYRRAPGGVLHNLSDWRHTLLNLRDVMSLGLGVLQSLYQLWRFKPDVVFDKAGPAGLPVGLAAHWLGVPLVIHEPDAVPGLANRTLARWASKVAVGFPAELYSQFSASKVVYTGTPVRAEVLKKFSQLEAQKHFFGPHLTDPSRPVVLVVGGSQGAQAINQLVEQALPKLLQKVRLIHVVGTANGDEIDRQSSDNGSCYVTDYLTAPELAQAYAAADLVVARAGANTIAELASLGKPTILMPNQVMAAHQMGNAEILRAAGAADILTDEASVDEFTTHIFKLTGSSTQRRQLSQRIKHFDQSEATERLCEVVIQAAERGVNR